MNQIFSGVWAKEGRRIANGYELAINVRRLRSPPVWFHSEFVFAEVQAEPRPIVARQI